jgi:3-oxoacyl-[acyl-carrier protein] reductase
METGLKDRVALIAGASQGMGRATARAFAAEGTNLALCARNLQALDEVRAEIRQLYKVDVYVEALDVSGTAAVDSLVANTAKRFGRIDIAVSNAGGPPPKQFLDTNDDDWYRAFALNLHSAVTLSRAVIPHMQRQHWGRIIMISSITVREPQPDLVLSNAIRTGVMGLVRSLATDFGKDGILVNNVAPGYIATDRVKELTDKRAAQTGQSAEQIEKTWTRQIPLDRLGQPEEIADTIVWLASERAAFITGQTILVDGGMYKGL